MAAVLPYLPSPGSIKTALEKIKAAATPDRVSGDFINTKLQLKGGTGAAMLSFLKKIGFVGGDGTPTDIYRKFRGGASGQAVAEAILHGYKPLSEVNEYFFDLVDKELLALILQVTGAASDSPVPKLTLSTLKALKSFADFESEAEVNNEFSVEPIKTQSVPAYQDPARLGLNLSYTINLNLPATSDQAVFNAIFRSLREHLLTTDD